MNSVIYVVQRTLDGLFELWHSLTTVSHGSFNAEVILGCIWLYLGDYMAVNPSVRWSVR